MPRNLARSNTNAPNIASMKANIAAYLLRYKQYLPIESAKCFIIVLKCSLRGQIRASVGHISAYNQEFLYKERNSFLKLKILLQRLSKGVTTHLD